MVPLRPRKDKKYSDLAGFPSLRKGLYVPNPTGQPKWARIRFIRKILLFLHKLYILMNDDTNKQISDNKQGPGKSELNVGRGCRFCHNEGEVSVKPCESCYKLHTTDWLADYPDVTPTDIFEVRFKNTHRSYYKNVYDLPLKVGDIVAVEASPGHDIGIVSLTGDMVAKQMRRVGFNPQNGEFKKIYRKAKPYDIERWQEAIALEHETMIRSRQIAADMNLNMKIGDVEYQGDKIKAIFYYIADERVDFRELIKVFAEQFHIRVEMKQIGARQEAGRIGGLGSCGRQLCCASWMANFVSVTTGAAHTQDLSLNPQKLAGQCSKLKCCLIYELDNYIDARKEFPKITAPLQASDADYFLVKTDILARTMSFSTTPNSLVNMVTLPVARVKEILRLNAAGKKPERITPETENRRTEQDPGYVNVIGEESITRFDNAKKKKRKKKKKTNGEEGGGNNGGNNLSAKQQDKPQEGSSAEAGDKTNGNNERRGNRNRPDNGNRNQRRGNQRNDRRPRPESGEQSGHEAGDNARRGDRQEVRNSDGAQGAQRQAGIGQHQRERRGNDRKREGGERPQRPEGGEKNE